jgi:SHS2 domain-containing protein
MDKFKIIDHPSDIGLEAYGKDLGQAFENAALGMFSVMYELSEVRETTSIELEVEAEDKGKLLVDWLSEIIYAIDVKKIIFRRCVVEELSKNDVRAKFYGEPVDLSRHRFYHYIKAATYSQLLVEEKEDGSKIWVIFDI